MSEYQNKKAFPLAVTQKRKGFLLYGGCKIMLLHDLRMNHREYQLR